MNMTEALQYIQDELGFERFKFINIKDIIRIITTKSLKSYSEYFPFKTLWRINPETDAVDQQQFPGLFKIIPDDCPIENIMDVGMVYTSSDQAVGGFTRSLGRSVYGSINALIYNQLATNIASAMTPQQTTCEFVRPNMVQLYPKNRFQYGNLASAISIELLLVHNPNLTTINFTYRQLFLDLCTLDCKIYIYNKYRDLAENGMIGGHQVYPSIQEYSSAKDERKELFTTMQEEFSKNPDRHDFFYII